MVKTESHLMPGEVIVIKPHAWAFVELWELDAAGRAGRQTGEFRMVETALVLAKSPSGNGLFILTSKGECGWVSEYRVQRLM